MSEKIQDLELRREAIVGITRSRHFSLLVITLVDRKMDKLKYYRQSIEKLLFESGQDPSVNGEIEV